MIIYREEVRSSSKDSGQRDDKPNLGSQMQHTADKRNWKAAIPSLVF